MVLCYDSIWSCQPTAPHLGVGPEGPQVDLPGRDGPHGVDDDRHERLLEVLVEQLRGDVYAGQPAAVAGVGVVPADRVLQTAHLRSQRSRGSGHMEDRSLGHGDQFQSWDIANIADCGL